MGIRSAGAALLPVILLASGCSIRSMAVNALAKGLSGSGDVFASDDDPELIRDATPFALKTTETLLAQSPRHPGLLLSACSGFTQYAYAFVQSEADELESTDPGKAAEGRHRALRLYLRAREYGLRGLELKHAGIRQALLTDPAGAVASASGDEVGLLYWTGAAWGGAVSLGKDRADLLADTPVVRALIERALALDDRFDDGSIWELKIALDALPQAMGGSTEKAKRDFDRALELSKGRRASIYVSFAENVSVPAQDRATFDKMIDAALAIDPDVEPASRLANLIAQRRARRLKARAADLFLEDTP